jgi:hypothetical protein
MTRLNRRACVAFASSVALLLLALAFLVQPSSGAPAAAPGRVIDRTLLCFIPDRAGIPVLEVYAQPTDYPSAHLRTGFGNTVNLWLVGAWAGGPGRYTLVISRPKCRADRARIPLSARGLSGGRADAGGVEYECFGPRRILVRIRTVFRSPTSLRVDRREDVLTTGAAVKESYIAARTQAGKPLAFASVSESGTRLFTAASCIEDNT